MAIKGFSDLLEKFSKGELTAEKFEEELGKSLALDFIPKTKFNEINEGKKLVEKNLEDANKTLETLKQSANLSDEYKKQIEELKANSLKEQESFKEQLAKIKLDTAIDSALTNAKAKNNRAVKALLDTSKISVSDDGSLIGIKEQLETIIKENDFLFDVVDDEKPAFGGSSRKERQGGGENSLFAQMMASAGLSIGDNKK